MKTTKLKLIKLPEELEMHNPDKELPWEQAMVYAGSIGMRLPTKFELQVIAESTDEFNDLGCCWSASTRSNFPSIAWAVTLTNGNTFNFNKTNSNSVLCVKD